MERLIQLTMLSIIQVMIHKVTKMEMTDWTTKL